MATFKLPVAKDGSFQRPESSFRNFVSADGSTGFKAEAGRYHLYISYGCPWASRTTLVRKLKGLEEAISMDIVNPIIDKQAGSWSFAKEREDDVIGDSLFNSKHLKDIYLRANPEYEGRITVPVLWDRVKNTIVNNESQEIIRMLNSEFNQFAKNKDLDLYPADLRSKIDELHEWIYPNINNGVYRCGFATSQSAYEEAYHKLFEHLDKAESILENNRYLTGPRLTEADVKLFVSLIRFDAAYHGAFKCNKKMLVEYPNLWNYTREIYQMNGASDTVDFFHIKKGYYAVVGDKDKPVVYPIGPELNYNAPHNRNSK
eukprot:TRINITY_DN8775_c0_g1_i1.p1 TRINITY_DN8775_c0_g1~~TRINITY_DN8775_c0_g1_i1.p1  ORF type:complete len:316 (+),score=79.43 TRINITY_DN8775_c0_g1_i1:41-988(+)